MKHLSFFFFFLKRVIKNSNIPANNIYKENRRRPLTTHTHTSFIAIKKGLQSSWDALRHHLSRTTIFPFPLPFTPIRIFTRVNNIDKGLGRRSCVWR
jgi:hypothetical protein